MRSHSPPNLLLDIQSSTLEAAHRRRAFGVDGPLKEIISVQGVFDRGAVHQQGPLKTKHKLGNGVRGLHPGRLPATLTCPSTAKGDPRPSASGAGSCWRPQSRRSRCWHASARRGWTPGAGQMRVQVAGEVGGDGRGRGGAACELHLCSCRNRWVELNGLWTCPAAPAYGWPRGGVGKIRLVCALAMLAPRPNLRERRHVLAGGPGEGAVHPQRGAGRPAGGPVNLRGRGQGGAGTERS
jgi:hypothetical protein